MEDLRKEIDKIDDEIAALFQRRMALSGEIARYKQEHGLPVLNPGRERDILYRICSNTDEGLRGYAKILFNTIFDISRAHQSSLLKPNSTLTDEIMSAAAASNSGFPQMEAVACQGIEGAYSQLAAEKVFSLPRIMYTNTFDNVFRAVDKDFCKYGLLPIENSVAGSVTEVYELMKKYKFYIVRSVKLRVNHVLLTKKGVEFKDIKEIFSHEQAITQCSEFLKANPDIKVTVCENTAVAAMMTARSERRDVAALSSRNCAGIYDLTALSSPVQNSDNNYTRFICISKNLEIFSNANKISLMMTLDHKAGTLYSLLTKFSMLGLNLTKLESRPMKGTDFEFMFYFDVDGSVNDEKTLNLIGQLDEQLHNTFTFLGNYSEIAG